MQLQQVVFGAETKEKNNFAGL
jgi:hypothetical protein